MKKLLSVSLLLASSASAGEPIIRDIWFQAPVGVWGGNTQLEYSKGESKTSLYTVKYADASVFQEFNYTVIDDLSLSLSGAYLNSDNHPGGTATGLGNPNLGVEYRKLLSMENSFYFRGKLHVTPSLGKKSTRNQLSGNNKVTYTAGVGQVLGAFQYSAGIYLAYIGETKKTSGSDLESRFDYGLLLAGQYDINEKVSANLSLNLYLPGKIKAKSGAYTVKTDYKFVSEFGASYLVSEKLVTSLMGEYIYKKGTDTGLALTQNTYGIFASAIYTFN